MGVKLIGPGIIAAHPLFYVFGSNIGYSFAIFSVMVGALTIDQKQTWSRDSLVLVVLYLLINIICLAATFWSENGPYTAMTGVLSLIPIILFMIVSQWDTEQVEYFLKCFSVMGFTVAAWALVDWFVWLFADIGNIHADSIYRATAFFERPTILSDYLLVFVFTLLSMVVLRDESLLRYRFMSRRVSLPLAMLAISMAAVAMVLAFGKKELIAATLSILIYLFIKKRSLNLYLGLLLSSIVIGGLAAAYWDVLLGVFRIKGEVLQTGSRLTLWTHSISAIIDQPLFGMGAGNWDAYLPTYNGGHSFGGPHNSWLQLQGEYGVVVLTLYMLLVFTLLFVFSMMLIRAGSPMVTAAFLLLLATLIIELFSNPLIYGWTNRSYWLWMVFGLAFSEQKNSSARHARTGAFIGA